MVNKGYILVHKKKFLLRDQRGKSRALRGSHLARSGNQSKHTRSLHLTRLRIHPYNEIMKTTAKKVTSKHNMLLRAKIAWEAFEGVEEKGIGLFSVPRTITFKKDSKRKTFLVTMSFICTRIKNHSHIFVLTPALQVGVGCPGSRGCNSNHIPRRKNTHRPTNPQPRPRAPPPPLPPPPTIEPVTLRPETQ